MGVAYVCLTNQMLLPFGKAMLVGFYLLIAVATEAMIASNFRPGKGLLVALNIAVAAIVLLAGRSGTASLKLPALIVKLPALIAIVTLVLRLAVGAASLRASKVGVWRGVAALVGGAFLLVSVIFTYNLCLSIYENYFFYPRLKEGYIMPTRWQDSAWLLELLCEIVVLLYFGYRLLKYAFRNKPTLAST